MVRNNSYPAAAYDRQVIRVWLAVAASLVAGTSLTACGSTPGAAPGTSTLPPTPGELVTHVTSVNATLEPYNPQLTDQGVPAEQVNFIVTSVSGPFSCRVDVRRWGRMERLLPRWDPRQEPRVQPRNPCRWRASRVERSQGTHQTPLSFVASPNECRPAPQQVGGGY